MPVSPENAVKPGPNTRRTRSTTARCSTSSSASMVQRVERRGLPLQPSLCGRTTGSAMPGLAQEAHGILLERDPHRLAGADGDARQPVERHRGARAIARPHRHRELERGRQHERAHAERVRAHGRDDHGLEARCDDRPAGRQRVRRRARGARRDEPVGDDAAEVRLPGVYVEPERAVGRGLLQHDVVERHAEPARAAAAARLATGRIDPGREHAARLHVELAPERGAQRLGGLVALEGGEEAEAAEVDGQDGHPRAGHDARGRRGSCRRPQA